MALSLQRYTWHGRETGLDRILKERAIKKRERSVVFAIKIGEALPENVIFEILSWLPVKELLQFKSVCKTWYAIISSPDFVSQHLNNYHNNNSNEECLIIQNLVSHAELLVFELLVDEALGVLNDEVLYDIPMYGSFLCGPCDGIYYLYDADIRAFWNPVINELNVLPPIITKPDLPSNLRYYSNDGCGFGYDMTSNDYKVIVFQSYMTKSDEGDDDQSHPQSVFIYSLKTDSWRYKADLAREYIWENRCYMFLNGCYYWLGTCKQDFNIERIVCYDMGTDAVQETQVPNYDQPASTGIAIYDNSLAFLAVERNEKRLDIWIWNEGLWTKNFTVGPFSKALFPIGHWHDKIILENHVDGLCLCDPISHELKDLKCGKSSVGCSGVYVYRESLLSLKDKKWCKNNDKVEKSAQPRKFSS